MATTYSLYEAKAKFSEVMRKVRAGQRIVIAYRHEEIAEIRPIERAGSLSKRVARLEDAGTVGRLRTARALAGVTKRRGTRAIPRGARVMLAYVDTSCLVAIAFTETGAARLAGRLRRFERLFSSNLLRPTRSALIRERVRRSRRAPVVDHLMYPNRPLTSEYERIAGAGYLKGADLWHLANALFLAPDGRELTFLTLDRRQQDVAARLGFAV
jgi:prevent-host-death family protein